MPQAKPTIVITGGSGFLGINLARALIAADYAVRIIARHPPAVIGAWTYLPWDGRTVGTWSHALDGAAAIINLAGRSVDCIKTPDNCDDILRSRVETTRVIGQALRQLDNPPPAWIQMSTAHIYGDPPKAICTEESAPGYGLAPFVGQAWEQEYHSAVLPTMRQVILRTSFVLGRHGGALPRLALVARLGLGGKIGDGGQGISWIHETDMNRLFMRAINEPQMTGVYLATAPAPVSNAEFMRQLRKALGVPIGLPAAAWMVKIGAALLLKTDPELALYGRYCISRRLADEGFEFIYPTIGAAFAAIYGKPIETR